MKTSRTLLCGYSKPFSFFVLFAMGTIVAMTMASEESSTTGSQPVAQTPAIEQKENAQITPSPGKHSNASVASPDGSVGRKDTVVTPKQTHDVTKSLGGKKSSNETTTTNIDTREHNTANYGNYRCSPLGVNSLIIILLLSLRI